jgi:hypothetical protein
METIKQILKYCLKVYIEIFKCFIGALGLILGIAFVMGCVFAPIGLALDYNMKWAWFLYLITLPIVYYLLNKLDE